MHRFFKGIFVGIGGIAPGLSGTVLLLIFGMYQQTIDALGSLFVDFRKKIRFLLPLVAGMFLGVLLFSKLIDYCLAQFEMLTRYCFLGLIIGTLPMVWKEVRKEGFSGKYYVVILASAAAGLWLFSRNPEGISQITDPTFLQRILLGIAVAASAIIPGVDPAVLLTTLGLYETYVGALAALDLSVLLPMLIGLGAGAVGISFFMSTLFKRFYTAVFSVLFGVFLSMIPNMLTPACALGFNAQSLFSLILMLLGFAVSWYLGDFKGHNAWLKAFFDKKRKRG